jgi:nitroreductase
MTDTLTTIANRTAANNFDPTHVMTAAQIEELVSYAQHAPTAFNLQNWRVVAFSSKDQKEALKGAAYGQQKVADAAVTFVVVGIKDGYKEIGRLAKPLLDAGVIDQAAYDGWVGMTVGSHENNPQLQHDEAFRSASLVSMTLMLAAQAKGYVTGPMSGFVPDQVSAVAGLGANEVPVMLIAVGNAAPGNWPRKPRRPVSEQVKIV